MKRNYVLLILLLLAAAGIGWFLPALLVESRDAALAGKPEPVSIRQIDLSYQTDLSAADKLRLVREGPVIQAVPLERGIFITERDVRSVLTQFLQELTGNAFEAEEAEFSAVPVLLSFGEEGSVLAWSASLSVRDRWHCEAVVDDQTGLLLQCDVYGNAEWWETLFYDLDRAADGSEYVRAVLGEALCAHCNRQLSTAYTVSLAEEDLQDFGGSGQLLFSENGQERLRVPFLFVATEGMITINQ